MQRVKLRVKQPQDRRQIRRSPRWAFLTKSIKRSTNDCIMWPWPKSKGYPMVWYEGTKRTAATVVLMLTKGKKPKGKECRHLCGQRECINKKHLAWSTHRTNLSDKAVHSALYGRSLGGMTGKKHSEEAKQKMRTVKLGKKASAKTRAKMSKARRGANNAFYGKRHSEETKARIAAKVRALGGRSHTAATKAKIAAYARQRSPEHLRKLSEAAIRQHAAWRAAL